MRDHSIFNDNSNQPDQTGNQGGNSTPPNSQPNDATTLLMSIKNENGEPKYKTVEEGLKALQHSQTFIEQLKREKATADAEAASLREKADKITELERTVQELIKGNTNQSPGATTPQTIDEASIAALVERTLTENQKKAVREQNLSNVVRTLEEKFGTEASEKFYSKAQELGLSKAEMNELAAKSPIAVVQLFGLNVNQKQSQAAPTTSSFNTSVLDVSKNTDIKANPKSTLVGATTHEIMEESRAAKRMVDELHAQGKSVHDLTDPKVYFATFRRG